MLMWALTISAQDKVDLQVKLESQPESARGGETIKYTYSIRNNGPTTAVNTVLIGSKENLLNYESATASKGNCTIDERDTWILRCRLGDLLPDQTVTVEVSAKVSDFDDLNFLTGNGSGGGGMSRNAPINEPTYPLSHVRVSSSNIDTNEENDFIDLMVKLFPSANKAPIVRILSPKDEAKLIRPAGLPITSTVTIEASDLDGKVVSVKVVEPLQDIRPVGINEKGYIFEYEGVRYSAPELEEYLKRNPPTDKLATPTGKNIYTYTMTYLPYGVNQLRVEAVDDGGRKTATGISFEVIGDSKIEIVSPKRYQIVSPGSPLTVETISTLKQGRIRDVTITGDGIGYPAEPVKMVLVSKQGNVYRHRFQINEIPFNSVYSNLQVRLYEESGGYVDAGVGFLVRDPPKMSFTSFNDGDSLERSDFEDTGAKVIRVGVEIANRNYDDDYELLIDGKYYGTFSSEALNWLNPTIGKHTLQIVASFDKRSKVELARSLLITVTVR